MPTSRRAVGVVVASLVTGVVVYLSLGDGVQLPRSLSFNGIDKLQHVAAYCTLGVLWSYALQRPRRGQQTWSLWQWLWALLFGLGAVLELMQYAFFPGRYFEFADMLANGVGAGIGTLGFNRIFPT